jgi:large subunit ribosomal protein L1
MAQMTKRRKAMIATVDKSKRYTIVEATEILKKHASKKFNESIDLAVNLGIDAKKSDQSVRGATILPKGNGRTVRVAVFTEGAPAEAAKNAGADIVGFQDLAQKIKAGELDFDVLIATPDAMRHIGQLGQILGPRGLMPNPKVGTVTTDVATAVRNAKSGQAQYRTDKNGLIHCSVGRVNFAPADLEENIRAVINDLKKLKPSSSKGIYLKKITLSSTMGLGLVIDEAAIAG